jgi:hypothetical protein
MEYPGVDLAGTSFLAGYFYLVVCWRFGLLGFEYFGGYVARRLGSQLRQRKRPTKGE